MVWRSVQEVSWVERKFGASVQMEATYTQTPQLLTVDRQGFAFRKTDLIPIDNKPEIQEDSLLVRAIYDSHALI